MLIRLVLGVETLASSLPPTLSATYDHATALLLWLSQSPKDKRFPGVTDVEA